MEHTLFSDWSSNWHILDMSDLHSSFSSSDCIRGHYTRAGCALQNVKMKKVFWRKGDQWPASLRECPFFSEPTQRCVGGGKMLIQEKIFPSFWAIYKVALGNSMSWKLGRTTPVRVGRCGWGLLTEEHGWENAQALQTRRCYFSSWPCSFFASIRAKHTLNSCASKLALALIQKLLYA